MNDNKYKLLALLLIALISAANVFAAIPSGYYYYAQNKKQAALKTALHTYTAPLRELDYGSGIGFTWEGFFYTDQNADGSVIDMYSNTFRNFNGFAAVDGMHIEHSFPKSWWGSYPNNAYKDLFHLYPADAVTNMTKSNLPLGEVTGIPSLDNGLTKIGENGFGAAYTDKCFEPADEYKGDFARSYFYISTVYEDYYSLWQSPMMNNNTYPVWKPWALDLLLKWHRQDPVSAKELARIEAVYNLQGNRNPFIDYPTLVEYIWGKDTANVFPFPVETEPFLLTPRRGATLDFGVIMVTDVRIQHLHIQGANITNNISIKLLNNRSELSLSTATISSTDIVEGFDVSISFSPLAPGLVLDTLIVEGGGLSEKLHIPIKALASADFITLNPTEISPVGGTLNWISDPLANSYQLTLFQGEKQAGDLIISSYVEGSSWNKAIEIFNGTGKIVDLSNYSLKKQTDGAGDFTATIQLSGELANNKSYVIANNNRLVNSALVSKAQRLDSLISFNGNDAVALVRSGVTIDMVGQANAGAAVTWGADLTLQRKSTVTHPLSTFNTAEWETLPIDTYTMLGNHSMTFPLGETTIVTDIVTDKKTSYSVQNLNPQSTYTYKVEALRPDGKNQTVNTMQLHTSALDIPILMQATDVQAHQFKANWEETLFATGYIINVFEVSGAADTTEVEGFLGVGTSGKPLPSGWTGTVSGNYTSATSVGLLSPSVAFKNAGEWLQTKMYPHPVSYLKFMYRFATYVAGASFIVDGFSNGNWVRIDSVPCKNNTKIDAEYALNTTQAMNSFRITFNKMPGGNFAIDDVQATYGNQDTLFVMKDVPIVTNSAQVANLKQNYPYFYQVRATLGTSVSQSSETIEVKTLFANKTDEYSSSSIKISSRSSQLSISGLKGTEMIQLYSLTGVCLFNSKANSNQIDIPMTQKGMFIIQIKDKNAAAAFKYLKLN